MFTNYSILKSIKVIHRHQNWKDPIPDFAPETVGSNHLAKTPQSWRWKSSDGGRAGAGRAEAPSMPCGQGKGGEETLAWPCCGES